jgi:hypothetical protein
MPFPLDESCIVATEQRLGLRLPEAYRQRMLRENGGVIPTPPDAWHLHPIFDNTDRKRLKRTVNDIVRETGVASDSAGWPERAISIGANGGGDHLVLLRSIGNPSVCEPHVYWWDHETGDLHSLGKAEMLFGAAN